MAVFGITEISAEEPVKVDAGNMEILRVVEDKDGTTNVRTGASLDAKVTGKVVSECFLAGAGRPLPPTILHYENHANSDRPDRDSRQPRDTPRGSPAGS